MPRVTEAAAFLGEVPTVGTTLAVIASRGCSEAPLGLIVALRRARRQHLRSQIMR
jgi:hypothetical protein